MKGTKKQAILIFFVIIFNILSIYISLNWSIKLGLKNIKTTGTYGFFGTFGWPNAHQIFDKDIQTDISSFKTGNIFGYIKSPHILFTLFTLFISVFIRWDALAFVISSIIFYELTIGLILIMGYKTKSLTKSLYFLLVLQTNPVVIRHIWTGLSIFSQLFAFLLFYIIYIKNSLDNCFISKYKKELKYLSITLLILSDVLFAIIILSLFILFKNQDLIENFKNKKILLKNSQFLIYGIFLLILVNTLFLDYSYLSHKPFLSIDPNQARTIIKLIEAFFYSFNMHLFLFLLIMFSWRQLQEEKRYLLYMTIIYGVDKILFNLEYTFDMFYFPVFLFSILSFEAIELVKSRFMSKNIFKNQHTIPLLCFLNMSINIIIVGILADISLLNRILFLNLPLL